jgi:hypothetical protein
VFDGGKFALENRYFLRVADGQPEGVCVGLPHTPNVNASVLQSVYEITSRSFHVDEEEARIRG